MPLARGRRRVRRLAPLLRWKPTVYLGPGVESALGGERCVLLGARRPRWVDVLEVDPRGREPMTSLVERRFQPSGAWDAVGLSLPQREAMRHRTRLLRELVPGDVLLSGGTPLVHMGDRWERAKLSRESDARSRTSTAT